VGLDGSSGSIEVDKYGFAGQGASATQSIGAITIDAGGGYGTTSGNIFYGLAMGIGDSSDAEGAGWIIPLVGLEKKMDDICLINVPFFDGKSFQTAADFLTKYAGLVADYSFASPTDLLQASSDVNVARYDWKSGTTVRSAIDDICESTLHTYVVKGGKIYFYKCGVNGLPTTLGTDWGPTYSSVKIVSTSRTPDFDDLRNEIVVMGLQAVPDGQGSEIEDIPTFPRVELRTNSTTPTVPWSKSIFKPLPGQLTVAQIEDAADRLASLTSLYYVLGSLTIPGNASISPYDKWNSYVIHNVTHNLDLQSKSWTTSLEFTLATS
jgi:hypothetical protein